MPPKQKKIVSKDNLGKWFDLGNIESKKVNPKLPVINATSVAFIPTATGNTTNINEFIIDSAGDLWFIDLAGNGIKFPKPSVFKHSKEWHVDKNGNDTTGTGAEDAPFLTIGKALSLAGNTGEKIIVHAGTYAENINISQLNLDIVGESGTLSGVCYIQGTITVSANGPTSSVRIANIMTDTIVHSGSVRLMFDEINLKSALTKSGTGSLNSYDSSIVGANITGTGTVAFVGGEVAGLTVNNEAAIVSCSNVNSLAVVTATNGVLGINDTSVFAASAAGTAITAAAASTVIIKNSSIYDSTGVATKVTLSGNYSIENVYFNKIASTLGTNLNQIDWFNDIGLINVATITGATKMLVRDADGIIREQLIPSASGGTTTIAKVVYFNGTNPATATIFSLENPPITNDNTLKKLDNAIYIGTDESTWNSDGTNYATYIAPASTEWNLTGTSIDAGANKASNVWRPGAVSAGADKTYGHVTASGGTPFASLPPFNIASMGKVKFTPTSWDGNGFVFTNTSAGTGAFSMVTNNDVSYFAWLKPNNTRELMAMWSSLNLILLSGTGSSLPVGSFPSAKFAIESTNQGFLNARMTTAQRKAIVSPADGLEVYDTDLDEPCVFRGTRWTIMYPEWTFEEFIATADQTVFSLLANQLPVGTRRLHVTRNGPDISPSFSVTGTAAAPSVTYAPASNGGKTMDAGDKVVIHYEYYKTV